MNTPSPWMLLIGGGSLLNVSLMVAGTKAPAWVRYPGAALCIALGLVCIALALHRYFKKKPARPRYQPKNAAPIELLPESAARASLGPRRARKRALDSSGPPNPRAAKDGRTA